MGDCECLPRCPFFNGVMKDMPATSERLKKKYCLSDSANCARYQIFKALGSAKVPPNLFPNQIDRVQEIIAAG